jgi:hypothetical protein
VIVYANNNHHACNHYYRHIKPQGSGISTILQELNAYLVPSARHVVEMKQNQVKHQKSEADAPSEPPDRSLIE